MALVADDETAEVAEPSKPPLDLPATLVAAMLAAVLGLGPGAVAARGRDHLDALRGACGIQQIGIVDLVADEARGQRTREADVEDGLDEGDLMRRSAAGACGERKTSAVCHSHVLRTLARLGFAAAAAPLLAAMNMPTMKHSDISSLPRSRRPTASAVRIRVRVPSRTHA